MTIEERQIETWIIETTNYCEQCKFGDTCFRKFISFLQKCQKEIRSDERQKLREAVEKMNSKILLGNAHQALDEVLNLLNS